MIATGEDKAPQPDSEAEEGNERVPETAPEASAPSVDGPTFRSVGLSLELQRYNDFEVHFKAPTDVLVFTETPIAAHSAAYDSDIVRQMPFGRTRMHFHPAGSTVYSIGSSDKPFELVTMAIDPMLRQAVEAEVGGPPVSMRVEIDIGTSQAMMLSQSVHRFMRSGYLGGRLVAEGLAALSITEALMALRGTAATEEAQATLSRPALERTLEYIEANLEIDLRLADLASIACLSQHHFSRAFKASTGKPPSVYVLERRVERAKHLLIQGEAPLVAIAEQCGFSSQSHLTTMFRKLTGITPGQFRREGRGG